MLYFNTNVGATLCLAITCPWSGTCLGIDGTGQRQPIPISATFASRTRRRRSDVYSPRQRRVTQAELLLDSPFNFLPNIEEVRKDDLALPCSIFQSIWIALPVRPLHDQ